MIPQNALSVQLGAMHLHSLPAPAAVYTVLPVHELQHEQVVLEGGITFEGRRL